MPQPVCLHCERDEMQTPLISFQFRGQPYWICPQHLPILIHQPHLLEEKLPGTSAGLAVDEG